MENHDLVMFYVAAIVKLSFDECDTETGIVKLWSMIGITDVRKTTF